MEWWMALSLFVCGLLSLMLLRVPIAFAFLVVNILGAMYYWGEQGSLQVVRSFEASLTNFSLVPIVLFILMGEVMFRTDVAPKMLETVDKWMGRIPGRLSLLSITGGTVLSTLTGSSVASTAMMGSTLTPVMERKRYKTQMTLGPIMASGTLAVMIPPSALGVLLASIAKISIGQFMVAIILPGLLMACVFTLYIIIRVKINPDLAPSYDVCEVSFMEKTKATVIYILPLGVVAFLVIGLILLGVATPTQSAAMGVLASFLLAACYGALTRSAIYTALMDTMKISVMILMIVASSSVFSQLLAFSGAGRGLVEVIGQGGFDPLLMVIFMLLIVIIMGSFMEALSILMITLPIFIPIAQAMGIDLIWLSVLILVAIEFGAISPPFGIGLFVIKGVMGDKVSMREVYIASIPFLMLILFVIGVIIAVPGFATWLPEIMRN